MELIACNLQAYLYYDLQDTVAFLATVSSTKHLFSLGETHTYILTYVCICKGHKQYQLAKSHWYIDNISHFSESLKVLIPVSMITIIIIKNNKKKLFQAIWNP